MMNAVVVRGPMQFDVQAVEIPHPEARGMLVKVEACGLCGSDLRTIRSGHSKVRFPWTLGHEICGIVAEVGPEYSAPWGPGQRLAIGPLAYDPEDEFCREGRYELCSGVREIGQTWPGGLAEYVAIPPEAIRLGNILPVTQELPAWRAALIEPASSVIHAQERARIGPCDVVLVMGAGPIGCLHVLVARSRGVERIIVADPLESRLAMVQRSGADATLNTGREDLAVQVKQLTNGRMPDVIITATAAPHAQVLAVELARKGGRIVLFGGLPQGESRPGVDTNLIHYKNLDLIGTSIFAPRHFQTSLEMIASDTIRVDPLVTHVLPLSDFRRGVELALTGAALKVVFEP